MNRFMITSFSANKHLRIVLILASTLILVLLATKTWFDIDDHADTWWYHLPWAARLVGLVSIDSYEMVPRLEARFAGFPVLGELLQGVLWRIFNRPEATNLVSFVSLLAYFFFLRTYFKVPFYLSIPALLAVPLIQAHASSSYVDLPANIAMSMLIMGVYLLYVQDRFSTPRNWLVLFLTAAFAANFKLQLIPIVFLLILAVIIRVTWQQQRFFPSPAQHHRLAFWVITGLLLPVILYTPLRNTIIHHNPAYPVELSVFGHILPHAEPFPAAMDAEGMDSNLPRPLRWGASVLELGMGDLSRTSPERWTLDSGGVPGVLLDRQGGYFHFYVILHLMLFISLIFSKWRTDGKTALIMLFLLSTLTALMPQSHELRYYMYWIISLISLNLALLCKINTENTPHRSIVHSPEVVALVCFMALAIVVDVTDQNFITPHFYSFDDLLKDRVDLAALAQISDGDHICLAGEKANRIFLYASIFHPPRKYSMYEGPGPEEVMSQSLLEKACGNRKVITVN